MNISDKTVLLPSSLYIWNENTIEDIKDLKLTIFSRDFVSTENYKKYFKNSTVYDCPDMVLYFKKDTDECQNNNIITIARRDEKFIHIEDYGYKLSDYHNNFNWKNITVGEMYSRFMKFKLQFKQNKYIITDSLHCCIFSYIFNRYCYAFNNKYGKIFNTVNSYFQNSNIKLCNDKSDITDKSFENKHIKFDHTILIKFLKNNT